MSRSVSINFRAFISLAGHRSIFRCHAARQRYPRVESLATNVLRPRCDWQSCADNKRPDSSLLHWSSFQGTLEWNLEMSLFVHALLLPPCSFLAPHVVSLVGSHLIKDKSLQIVVILFYIMMLLSFYFFVGLVGRIRSHTLLRSYFSNNRSIFWSIRWH